MASHRTAGLFIGTEPRFVGLIHRFPGQGGKAEYRLGGKCISRVEYGVGKQRLIRGVGEMLGLQAKSLARGKVFSTASGDIQVVPGIELYAGFVCPHFEEAPAFGIEYPCAGSLHLERMFQRPGVIVSLGAQQLLVGFADAFPDFAGRTEIEGSAFHRL